MISLTERQIQDAIFVFLHGPSVYPEGAWEPVLLDVLHEVSFDAGRLIFSDPLYHSHAVGAGGGRIGCHMSSINIPFGVMVTKETNSSDRDMNAEIWLNEIALRITSLRIGCMIQKERTPEEARAHFRETAMLLNAGGFIDSHAEERGSISHDPKTHSEYESMHQNPPDGFNMFETFFAQALEELAELIERSKPLEPIFLTEFGDTFVQALPPGLHGKNLRDEMELQSGKHDVCGGAIDFLPTSSTSISAICKKCYLRVRLARSNVSTFAQLRDRGKRFVDR